MNWNWNENLLNVASAVRGCFGLPVLHPEDTEVKAWLNDHKFRCVILLLIDAMGSRNLNECLPEDSFLITSMKKEVSSVFPPTTAAATISVMTGKSPAENGWLGWHQYFPEWNDSIILFYGQSLYHSQNHGPEAVLQKLPYKPIYQELWEAGIPAQSVWPSFGAENPCADYAEILSTCSKIARDQKTRFIYAYWDQLDTHMHYHGPSSGQVKEELKDINAKTAEWVNTLPHDTGILIVADHGQTVVRTRSLLEYPEILDCLVVFPTLEGRTCAFHVKEGKQEEFRKLFTVAFGDDFDLWSQEEVIEQKLFGYGTPHPRFAEFIGDYLAIAKSDACLCCSEHQMKKKGDHAGITERERMVPVILTQGKR